MQVIKAGAGVVIARGHVTAVMIDTAAGKPVRIPDAFRKAAQGFVAPPTS